MYQKKKRDGIVANRETKSYKKGVNDPTLVFPTRDAPVVSMLAPRL